jgi:spore coat polysaccharide biosynthesis protein SpsF
VRRTRVVIQSRLNSSRLPGKALLTIAGMPLIELVARRASRSGHEVVVATSEEPYDARIAEHLLSVGVSVVRGSLDDVLGRFVQATDDLAPTDRVVRLTGDNPIADADLVDELLTALDASDHVYGRVDIDQVPEGLGAEAFSVEALRKAAATTRDPYDREHVTPWLRRTLGELLFVPRDCPDDIHAYRATVDTLSDYVKVSSLFDGLADPVGAPWLGLMREVATRADALGPRVPRRPGARTSRVILSARGFSANPKGLPPAEHAEHLRALLGSAIDRGVTHVDVGRSDGDAEELLRSVSEPSLIKRFAVVLRTDPRVRAGADPGVALEASVERSFAGLGRRGVDTLVLPDAATAEAVLDRAGEYRDGGFVHTLGLVVSSVADASWAVDRAELGYVELRVDPDPDPVLLRHVHDLVDRGVDVAAPVRALSAGVPDWLSAVIVTGDDGGDLEQALTLVGAGGQLAL